ncbi:MAG: hypothetical protein AB7S54_10860 [Bacteroidales bacterium]
MVYPTLPCPYGRWEVCLTDGGFGESSNLPAFEEPGSVLVGLPLSGLQAPDRGGYALTGGERLGYKRKQPESAQRACRSCGL